jgi:hypothetical protein
MAERMNNRQRLAAHLLQWHGGGGTSTYALGSYWYGNKAHTYNVGLECLKELRTVRAGMDNPASTLRHSSKAERRELTVLITKVERQVWKDQGAVIKTVKQLRKALRGKNGRMCVYLCIQGVPYVPVARAFNSPSDNVFLICPDEDRFNEELGLDKA